MGLDQIPVNSVPEQRIDVFVTNVLIGAEELVFAPVADARHQLDAQQMRKAEHRQRLPLRVGVDGVRLDVGGVLQQAIDDVDRLPDTARDEVAEQRDVRIGHVVVGDAAVAAIADVVRGEQILVVEVVLGAVGGRALAIAPAFGELQAGVAVDDVPTGRRQFVGIHMPAVDERQHVRRDGATQVSGSLGRSEIATIGEGGEDVALGRLLDLGVRAGQRTEVPGPARPVGHIAQDLDDAAFAHAV